MRFVRGKMCYFVGEIGESTQNPSMTNIFGEYEVSIDAKGRLLLPSGFRKKLPESTVRFIINRGFENCLTLFLEDNWNALSETILRLNDFNPKAREFKRLFLNGATEVDIDSAGRILLTKSQMEYAGIKKDMIVSAQGNKVELWDKDTYYKYIREHSGGFSDLAAEVAGGNFINPFEG